MKKEEFEKEMEKVPRPDLSLISRKPTVEEKKKKISKDVVITK